MLYLMLKLFILASCNTIGVYVPMDMDFCVLMKANCKFDCPYMQTYCVSIEVGCCYGPCVL